jgi:hypothetical protein
MRSAPLETPPAAWKHAATRWAPAVIVSVSATAALNLSVVNLRAGSRTPRLATSTRRATSNWSRP